MYVRNMSVKEEIISFLFDRDEPRPFQIELAGVSYCDGSYRICRPKSAVSCFEYVIKGTGTVVANGNEYHPSAGDMYFLHQGDDHLYYADAKEPWVKIWLNLSGPLVDGLVRAYGFRDQFVLESYPAKRQFEEFLAVAKSHYENYEELTAKIAVKFHQLLQSMYQFRIKRSQGARTPAQQIKTFIDKNVEKSLNIDQLSKLVYRSPSQVIRIFKKEYQMTPYDYMLKKKIELSKALLKGTNLSVKEIAFSLSFTDQHYFSNCFKKKVSVSPEKYRKGLGN